MDIHPSSLILHPSSSIAVLLLAFGGPEDMDSVEPFLRNILTGRPITPELVDRVKKRYALIGGKSPLPEITRRQAQLLEERLNSSLIPHPSSLDSSLIPHPSSLDSSLIPHPSSLDSSLIPHPSSFKVYVGMRYWHPFIKETVRQIKDDGIEKVIAIPMAAQNSKASTGGYIDALNKALEEVSGLDVRVVDAWHRNPFYVKAVAERVKESLDSFTEGVRKDVQVIFSAHSLPKKTVEGDPYETQLRETIEDVLQLLGPLNRHLAYQSKGQAPVEWLGPEVETVMEGLAREGRKDVLIVPIGFVCDHVETLYDIDIIFKKKAEGLGMNFRRAASLNDSPLFIEALADIVKENL
jgi:ferrochelatase